MAMHLYHINMLYLLWLLPLPAALFIYAARKRRQAVQALALSGGNAVKPLIGRRLWWRPVLIIIGLIFLIIALARPAWNRKDVVIKRSGRDVVFMLDVSRSMLAEDLRPNRLTQAKMAIKDTIASLNGDRVALVTFAGNAVIKCPLTLDYGFFRLALDNIGRDSVSRGGTKLGDALRTVLNQVFDDQAKQYKDIILLTDGGDHGSFPVEAAKKVGERGIRLIIVGLGNDKEGSRIPVLDAQGHKSFLKYKGREVWSKLDAGVLRRMAMATPGGLYLPVATGTINLGQVYRQIMARSAKKELASRTHRQYEEKFQIFLGAALFCLLLDILIAGRGRTPGNAVGNGAVKAGIVGLILLLVPVTAARAQSVSSLIKEGNAVYKQGKFKEAEKKYQQALKKAPDSPYVYFDLGDTLYKLGDFKGARAAYEQAVARSHKPAFQAVGRFNQGNATLRQAEEIAKKNPETALRGMAGSLSYYRQAMALKPGLDKAARNIEVAKDKIKAVKKFLARQQEAARAARQARKKMARKLAKMSKKQAAMAAGNRQVAKSGKGKMGKGTAAAEKQKKLNNETRQLADKLAKQQAARRDSQGTKAGKDLRQAMENQQKALRNLENKKPGKAAANQKKAADKLRQAMVDLLAKKPNKPQTKPNKKGKKNAAQGSNKANRHSPESSVKKAAEAGKKKGAAADKAVQNKQTHAKRPPVTGAQANNNQTARDILQQERLNDLHRQVIKRSQYEAVDKDW
ncbi:MAG TPA: VWA domain-containing protein [Desulfobacterales bacterium]|nr:VWA domain-containing protein [Desulfobacterales bacterium]